MIDLKLLSENTEQFKKALAKKHFKGDIDAILKMDEERRALIASTDELKAEQNRLAKEIPQAEDKAPLLEQSKNSKRNSRKLIQNSKIWRKN